jgi:hypothetical protein
LLVKVEEYAFGLRSTGVLDPADKTLKLDQYFRLQVVPRVGPVLGDFRYTVRRRDVAALWPAPIQQPKDKPTPDSSKTGGTGRPTAKPLSRRQQILRDAADETFPDGWGDLPTGAIIKQASKHRKVKAFRPEPKYDTWLRALRRRKS